MYKRILVPLDGSARAEQVLKYAENEAVQHDGELIFQRIIPPLKQGLMVLPVALEQAMESLVQIAWEYIDAIFVLVRMKNPLRSLAKGGCSLRT